MPIPTLLNHYDTAELRRHCSDRLVALDEKRQPWILFCTKVAEELFPAKLAYLVDPQSSQKAGEQNEHICDAVGHLSLNTSTGGVMNGSMPQTSRWFGLKVRGVFETDDDEQYFLDDSATRLLDLHNQSNTNQVMPECIKEWLAFGVGAALYLEDDAKAFRLEPLTVGEYWLAEDAYGKVDTIYRKLSMTVAQLVQEFGLERLSPSSQQAYQNKRYDQAVPIVNAIEPDRDGRNPIASEALPWRSVYYEESGTGGQVLAVRGFHRFPAMVWRYGKLSQSAYAYGLGHDVLPHLVRLKRLIYRYGQALARKADPPVQVPAGMSQHEVKAGPGGVSTYFGQQEIKALYRVELELREVAEQIQQTKQDIRDVLGATLVASLRRLTQTMTKAEAEIRKSEDLAEFLPGLMKLHEEMLSPYVEMLWDTAEYLGLLRRMPRSLLQPGRKIDIEFTSPLARRQRQGEADAVVRTVAVMGEFAKAQLAAGMQATVVHNIDLDEAIRFVAQIEGVPARIMVPIQRMREQRAAAAAQALAQKQAGAIAQGAEIAKTAAEAESLQRDAA